MATTFESQTSRPPVAGFVEFEEMKRDIWESVACVVYEEPEGHYAGCATPIASQLELDAVLQRPGVTQFRSQ